MAFIIIQNMRMKNVTYNEYVMKNLSICFQNCYQVTHCVGLLELKQVFTSQKKNSGILAPSNLKLNHYNK